MLQTKRAVDDAAEEEVNEVDAIPLSMTWSASFDLLLYVVDTPERNHDVAHQVGVADPGVHPEGVEEPTVGGDAGDEEVAEGANEDMIEEDAVPLLEQPLLVGCPPSMTYPASFDLLLYVTDTPERNHECGYLTMQVKSKMLMIKHACFN